MAHATLTKLAPHGRGDWVRLRTLVLLRWLAIAGQTIAVIAASEVLGLSLRLDLCALAIGASIAFNTVAMAVHPVNKRLTEVSVAATLIFDLIQLGLLLYLTGGLANPFSLLVLAPVTISATTLTLPATLYVGSAAIVIISLIGIDSVPLTLHDGTVLEPPVLLIGGMWVSLAIGIIFMALYARRVSEETYSMTEALTATQMALAREQKLTALGGVVAAAAHEMGTPLATIKLVTAELDEELQDRPDILEDIALIRSQAERCRDILRDMGRSGRDDAILKFAPVTAVVAEAAEPHLDRGKTVVTRIDGVPESGPSENEPEVERHPEILHGIRNLVQNAVDFAATTVWIDVTWDDAIVTVTIGDDGPGFPHDLLARIGDPFIRRRPRRTTDPARPGYEGMGLGLFIAKTLLERSGARLTFVNGQGQNANEESDGLPVEFRSANGAIVEVTWKRVELEAPKAATRQPLGRNRLNLP